MTLVKDFAKKLVVDYTMMQVDECRLVDGKANFTTKWIKVDQLVDLYGECILIGIVPTFIDRDTAGIRIGVKVS